MVFGNVLRRVAGRTLSEWDGVYDAAVVACVT